MVNHVFEAIADCGAELRALGPVNETLGRLDDNVVALLRDIGVTRILQGEDCGGFGTHPGDLVEAVAQVAACDGSAGWVAGAIGAAAWEVTLAPQRVRDEVWGVDADAWIAPAPAPAGVLQAAVDGYLLTGRWQAVPGIDHCDWVLLGAQRTGSGRPAAQSRVQVLVPRTDLRIVDESHDTVGLIGAGCRDIVVDYAAVPGYRVLDHDGAGAPLRRAVRHNPTYRIPAGTLFALIADAAIVGMAQGAAPAAEFTADLRAAHAALLEVAARLFNLALDRRRVAGRRVRRRRDVAVGQAVGALDAMLARSGSAGLRRSSPLQRFWRDAHMAVGYRRPIDRGPRGALTSVPDDRGGAVPHGRAPVLT